MSVTPFAINTVQQQLDFVLERLADQVRLRIPGVQCRIHHGSNDSFAWWVVARLSNPADASKLVDISIECRRAEAGMSIQADLAREDGTVLQEFSDGGLSAQETVETNGGATEPSLRGVERFLQGQAGCLVRELG